MIEQLSHIVFLTPGFPENEEDSVTIPAFQVYLKTLKKALPNTKMTVLTFQFPFEEKSYQWNHMEVIPLNGKNNQFKKPFVWNKALKTLKRLHQKNPITNLHSFWIGECSLVGQKFALRANVKHIVTAMGQDVVLKNFYVKFLNIKKTKIITLSKNHHDLLLKNHTLNSQIIPWFIDPENFPELQKSEINILGIGSLNNVKNYPTFINIIGALVKEYPKLKVEIIGSGVEKNNILKNITQLKLEKTISLLGKLPRKEVLKKMVKSDILLHTSIYESFGYVFLEGLYSGMKIVSFDVGVAKEIAEWKVCKSTDEMIVSINTFLNNNKAIKKRVLLNNYQDTINLYLKLYNA